jgi:ABC-type glycerol-3-phosphate transport system substrate-binding protein
MGRTRRTATIVIALAGALAFIPWTSASAPAGPPVPPMPAADAPITVWQTWAAQQRQAMEATDWQQAFASSGCTIDAAHVFPVVLVG